MMITKTYRIDHEVAELIAKLADERDIGQGRLLEIAIKALTDDGAKPATQSHDDEQIQ